MKLFSTISANLTAVVVFLICALIGLAFLAAISDIVKVLIVSALLAYVLDPLATSLESRGMSRTAATAVIFSGILVLAATCYSIFLPLLSSEIEGLKAGFNIGQAELVIVRFENFLEGNLAFLGLKNLDLVNKVQNSTSQIGEWLFKHILDAASIIMSIIIIPFIVFFLLKDGRQFKKALVSIMPNRYFELSLYLLHKLDLQVGNFLRGQMLDAMVVGIMAVCGMWLIGLNYFLLIGVFAGLANLIPYFGPITGAFVAVIVSILQTGSYHLALYVIIAFTVIKLIDDTCILPIVMGKSVHIHPLMVLLAILIGGKLFGILGMLLAVPVASFFKVIIHESILNYRKYKLA